MLSDILNAAGNVVTVVSAGIVLFAMYRAFTIGRVLVRGAYRDRALWTGGTMVALLLLVIASYLPSSDPLGGVAFVLVFLVLFAFVDSSIKVAQEMDFFHRSPLGWQRLRKPLYAILIGSSLAGASLAYLELSGGLLLGVILWFGGAGVCISRAAASLLVGARGTPDRSMRRFVRMLGWAVICMVIFFTIWIPFAPFSLTVQDLGSLISTFFLPAAGYFLYLAAMSLSPVGRVEKEASTVSEVHQSGVTQTAHP